MQKIVEKIMRIKGKLTKDSIIFILLSFSALAGMISGIIGIDKKQFGLSDGVGIIFGDNIDARLKSSFLQIFTDSLATYFIFMLIIFLLGLSVWGFLIVPFVVAYKGYGIGFLSGYLTLAYGVKGFIFYAVVILLGACASTLAIVAAGEQSVKMSLNMLKLASPHSNVNCRIFSSVRQFITRISLLMLILCASALLDGLMNIIFANFIK